VSNSATIGNLALGSGGATTLDFSYGFTGNPTNVALTAGSATITGTSTIRIGGSFAIGSFPVLKYSSLSGSFSGVSAPRGTTATLSNDTVNTTIYVVVTATGGGIVWTGTNSILPNLWDLNTTTNWLTGSTPTIYIESVPPGDSVTFNNLGSGTVLVSNTVSPTAVTISNSTVNYIFQGSGQINSLSGLTKLGSGTASLNLPGTYSGNTVISNGTLNLGANQTFANLTGNGTVDVSAGTPTLTLNDTTNTTFSGTIQGGLSLTKTGNGTLTLSGSAASTNGNLLVNAGSLKFTGGTFNAAATSGNTKIDTGGSLEVSAGATVNILNGGNAWFPIGDTTGTTNTVTVSGGTLMVSNNWGTEVGRIGSGVLTINSGTFINNDQGDVGLILGDQATAESGTVNLNGGSLVVNRILCNNGVNAFYFNGGTFKPTISRTDFFGSFPALSTYVRDGGAIVDTAGFNITIAEPLDHSVVSGDNAIDGGLTKTGNGTLTLNGVNSYTGSTTINAGTLGGTGTIAGVLTNNATLAPGDGGIGSLTINGNITLKAGSTNLFEVNGTTPANDSVVAGGNVIYGGVLRVVPSGTLTVGQTFTLFSGTGAASASNFASVQSIDPTVTFSFTNGLLTVVSMGLDLTQNHLTNSITGGGSTLSLSWSSGWKLQSQTNSLTTGLSGNWVTITDGTTTSTNLPIFPSNPSVFYRLISQ
jgi:autotransporter-associated beta strand protein